MLELTDVKESGGKFDPLPVGKYLVRVEDVQVKDTKDGTGQYFNVKFKVMDGKYNGRTMFHIFNIKNKSEKAKEIGLGQLKQLMRVSGVKEIDGKLVLADPIDLVNLTCVASVKIEKSEEYGDKNKITYFTEPTKEMAANTEDVPF